MEIRLRSFDPSRSHIVGNSSVGVLFFILKGGYNTLPVMGPFKAYVVSGCICELGLVPVVILVF